MDEQQTFDLFHEALDVQPPVGSFERLRARLLAGSVAPRRHRAIDLPPPRIRRSALAVALTIAIALAAAGGLLELHHALHQVIPAGSRGTIVIGSDNAISGADRQVGLPVQLGEAFAVARVGTVRGYRLKFVAYDDAVNGVHDQQAGARNVQRMLADPRLLAMIGPSDAATALAEIAIAQPRSLAMISPVNSYPCLTVNPCSFGWPRPTGLNSYFRIAAVDTFSGTAMADFAYDTLGLRTIALLDDQDEGSIASADGFAAEFARKGGKTVARQGFDHAGPPDFRPWLRAAKAAGAQAIYAASVGDGCVARAQSEGIFDKSSYYLGAGNIQEIGDPGDGIASADCIRDAGQMANDRMYATIGLGAAELNPDAQGIVAAYKAAHHDPSSISSGTFAGYDSAMILIDAIGRAIDANGGGKMPTRMQVLQQVAQTTNFRGLTGTYTFNAAGDPVYPTVQVVQNVGGTWTPVQNLVVSNPAAS